MVHAEKFRERFLAPTATFADCYDLICNHGCNSMRYAYTNVNAHCIDTYAIRIRMNDAEEIGVRLKQARQAAGFPKASDAAAALGIKYPTYAGHENGSRGVARSVEKYARRFHVSLDWLLRGIGDPTEKTNQGPVFASAPLISWVSAGALAKPEIAPDIDDAPLAYAPDLDPDGDWIALRVDGDSMNRISPHDSVIFVNRKDRRLVPNGCYIIGDGNGGATYKRYRPPNRWEPVSTNKEHEAFEVPVGQEPDIIGRVRKTILAM